MADWKTQVSYNYNPSYHAYAYGLMYQPGPEQSHSSLSTWGEAANLGMYNPGVTPTYCATTTRSRDEGSPHSPEDQVVSGHCHYQGSGVVFLGDSHAGRLLLSGPHRAYDDRDHEARREGCDSTSDSEAHTSPDSWSSSSSREGSLPQADPVSWVKQELCDETGCTSPDASEDVSSSHVEERRTHGNTADSLDNIDSLHASIEAPKCPSTRVVNNPKGKVRAAFSESQMHTLVQRFSVQRYLTPAEMKNLAEMTGLTYKQVKTWFQNRRMKLRRHQKDNSWVSERYTATKESPVRGSTFHNMPPHIPPYQGEARPQLKEHYNQHMMEAALKKTAPQNLAFYLAAMSSTAGYPGFPTWSSGSTQPGITNRAQATGWSMPPSVTHYEYNPNAFTSNNTGFHANFEGKDGDSVSIGSAITSAIVKGVGQ